MLSPLQPWEGVQKGYLTYQPIPTSAGTSLSAGIMLYKGLCAASTGWRLVGNFQTKWILFGKCWLTENKAFHSVCQLQWNTDWARVLCWRMEFLLKTADSGPPPNIQKHRPSNGTQNKGGLGLKSLPQHRFHSPSTETHKTNSWKMMKWKPNLSFLIGCHHRQLHKFALNRAQ